MLKCIGKYIEDSGLDRLFTKAEIYGENTLSQVLAAKHYKRAMEAHTAIYLPFFHLLFPKFLKTNFADPDSTSRVQSEIDLFERILEQGAEEECKQQHYSMLQLLDKEGVLNYLQAFTDGLYNQAQFQWNYMKMFESLLRFLRASHEGLWQLHLSSLNEFVQYFFAHDQLDYTRLSSVYLAEMQELKNSDAEPWLCLQDNFSICKSGIPFTPIGSGHAIEQKNKALRVGGGVTGPYFPPSLLLKYSIMQQLERNAEFIKERFHGCLSVWTPTKKRTLKSFKATKTVIKTKVGAKVVQLKEEKTLAARFLITARKRPNVDLEHCLGNFELSVVLKSLFTGGWSTADMH
eukprot:gene12400-13683_t